MTSGTNRRPVDGPAVVMDVGGGVELLIAVHDGSAGPGEGCGVAVPGYVTLMANPGGPAPPADGDELHYASLWMGIGGANSLRLVAQRESVPRSAVQG